MLLNFRILCRCKDRTHIHNEDPPETRPRRIDRWRSKECLDRAYDRPAWPLNIWFPFCDRQQTKAQQ